MSYWDAGRRAAKRGEPKDWNPFNNPDRQKKNNERNASLWDEGWEIGDEERKMRELLKKQLKP